MFFTVLYLKSYIYLIFLVRKNIHTALEQSSNSFINSTYGGTDTQ